MDKLIPSIIYKFTATGEYTIYSVVYLKKNVSFLSIFIISLP